MCDMPMRFASSLLVAGVLLAACDYRSPGGASKETPDDGPEITSDASSIETIASPLVLAAGETVSVRCVARLNGSYDANTAVTIDVSPYPVSVTQNNGVLNFRPTVSGDYLVRCKTADGTVIDTAGKTIQVKPAAAVSVETGLPQAVAQAGAPVIVVCELRDAFGNRIYEGEASGVDAPSAVTVVPTSTSNFEARGSTAGDYDLACVYGEYVDLTPETLSIVPGIPGVTQTDVSQSSVSPATVINVSCAVEDAFGNSLAGVPTSFVVIPANGSSPGESGVSMQAGSFSALDVGSYYVFCSAPGYFAGDESPALVEVHPGQPYSWVVDLVEQECYWQDRGLPIDVVVFDAWGNEIKDAPVEVRANGTLLTAGPSGLYSIDGEGAFSLDVSMPAGSFDPAGTIAPETAEITIDSTPPVFNITSPVRAGRVTAGGTSPTNVSITGSVSDTVSDIVSLSINGAGFSPSGMSYAFSGMTQSARWGVNVISGAAMDACGNRSVFAQSYMRSGAYYPGQGVSHANERTAQGILAQLNQPVIDDGTRASADDLATVLQSLLRTQDFNTLLPPGYDFSTDPLRSWNDCGFCDVWADYGWVLERDPSTSNKIGWGGPSILSLNAVNGGITVSASITDFDFPLHLTADDRECACGVEMSLLPPVDVVGWAGADAVTATGSVAVSLSGGAPSVSIPTLTLNTSGLYINLTCPWYIDWLCDGATSVIVSLLGGIIEDALAGVLADMLEPLLHDFIANFGLDTGFNLPAPLAMPGSPDLRIGSGLDRIQFCGPTTPAGFTKPSGCPATNPNPGYGILGLSAQVYPNQKDPNITAGLGAIRRNPVAPAFSNSAYRFGLGLSDDLVNQILWSLWYGGALNLTLSEILAVAGDSIDLAGIDMTLKANAPPVVMPGYGAQHIDVGWGDVEVEADVDLAELLGQAGGAETTLHVKMYLSALLSGSFALNSATNELSVTLNNNPQIYVQVFEIDDPGYQGIMSDLFAELLRLLLPRLLTRALGAFPLPSFDLSALAGFPAGTVWELTNGAITRETNANVDIEDYHLLTGNLR